MVRCDGYVYFMLGTALVLVSGCQPLPTQPHLNKSGLLGDSAPLPNQPNQPNQLAALGDCTQTATNICVKPVNDPALFDSISQHSRTTVAATSGYYPLATGADAFAARSLLIHKARHSIDVQYYIWHDDETGRLMLQDLYQAANRGVKVRLLLDDLNTNPRIDQQLLAFAKHTHVAVRLMNPKRYRKFLPLNYVTQLPTINRRMHNKSMTFDRQVAIVGGRNIGDEYLRNDKATQFTDLDVMLAGKVVSEVGQSFQQYWDSPLAFDIETLVKPTASLATDTSFVPTNFVPTNFVPTNFVPTSNASPSSVTQFSKIPPKPSSSVLAYHSLNPHHFPKFSHKSHKIHSLSTNYYSSNSYAATSDPAHLANTPLDIVNDPDLALVDSHILANNIPFRWTEIAFLADPVQKLINPSDKAPHLVNQLRQFIGKPQHEFTLISSYFVPTRAGIQQLASLVKSGVRVKILTNSFEATDVGAVHAGYSKSRKALLKAGIELYEYKSNAEPFYRPENSHSKTPQSENSHADNQATVTTAHNPPINDNALHANHRLNHRLRPYLGGHVQHEKAPKRPSLARTQATMSLHTKAFAVDNDKVFVGSYNIDPRSANINTELGVVIADPLLASHIHAAVGLNLRNQAYQVLLTPQGDLTWVTLENNPATHNNTNSVVKISHVEPKMSLLNRVLVTVFGYLPFNWML